MPAMNQRDCSLSVVFGGNAQTGMVPGSVADQEIVSREGNEQKLDKVRKKKDNSGS